MRVISPSPPLGVVFCFYAEVRKYIGGLSIKEAS